MKKYTKKQIEEAIAKWSKKLQILESQHNSITEEQWQEAADWFNANGYPIEDDEKRLEQFTPQLDQFLFKVGHSPTGKDEIVNGSTAWELYQSMKMQTMLEEYIELDAEKKTQNVNEGRGWYGGGYGGSGRSYSSFGGHAARGAEIGWYYVSEIDPRAKGKIAEGWRCGPSNFVYKDFLYPERTYKRGAFTLRNTHAPEFGNVQIGMASYFDAVNHNDTEAIEKLTKMGLPLNLTFGLKPDDDYTNNYKLR